ncbi:MAG: long-chain fatty acid--CoA ligase, partial [Pseudomonadota bacterium]
MNATQEEQFSSIAPGAALMEPGPIDGGGREGATALPLIDLRAYARRDAAPALVDEHGALSFAELADRGRRVAGLLRNAGLEPSDRVALMTADPRAVITLAPAVVRAGMTLVVIDPEGAVETVGRALRTSDARAVVADAALLQTLSTELGRDLPECRWRVGEVAGKSKAGGLLARALGRTRQEPAEIFAAVAAAEPDDTTVPSPDDTIPAYVMFTSGSTSAPKGVVVSRRALAAHLQTLKRELGYGPASRLLNLLPFHHTDGLIHGPMMAAFTGTTLVRPFVFATHRLAELSDVLRDAEVTHFLTVPTILALIQRLLSDQPELFRTGHFRTLVSTAGALDVGLWDDVQRTFGIRVANLYGLTETVSGAVYCGPGDHSWRLGTLGRPIDMEMRVVDEGGAEIAAGQPGELWLRGDNVMTGYLGDDVGTAAVLDDGWFRTGDIVRTDGDGFVHF